MSGLCTKNGIRVAVSAELARAAHASGLSGWPAYRCGEAMVCEHAFRPDDGGATVFTYDFVRHQVHGKKAARDSRSYQDVVHERASEGWRLVQVLVEQPAVSVTEYVLIFERPVSV